MAKGRAGVGVSVAQRPDGRWRVRWRESSDGRQVSRERVVDDEAAARRLQGEVLSARAEGQPFEPAPAPAAPRETTLDDVLEGWLRDRAAMGRVGRAALANNLGAVGRILRAARSVLKTEGRIPVSAVSLTLPGRLVEHMRSAGLADGTIDATLGALLAAWAWAADAPETFPGLPALPRSAERLKGLRPGRPDYSAPPAPTMAEVDALIRQLVALGPKAQHVALPVAVIGRYTGLRAGQILAIELRDLDLVAGTLRVRTGKSAAERQAQRLIPLAGELIPFVERLVAEAEAAGRELLLHRRADKASARPCPPDRTFRRAWEAATAAGEARREVWSPSSRDQGRPIHCLRAALQSELVQLGVAESTIDAIVGHGGLRSRHYVAQADRLDAMAAAVGLLPSIDWRS